MPVFSQADTPATQQTGQASWAPSSNWACCCRECRRCRCRRAWRWAAANRAAQAMGPASQALSYCCWAHAAARSVTFARGKAWTGRSRIRMPRTRHCRACRRVHRGAYPDGGVSLVDDSPMLTSSLSIESSAMKLPAGHAEAQSGSGSSASSASSSGLAAGQHSCTSQMMNGCRKDT